MKTTKPDFAGESAWGTLTGVRPSKLYRKIFSAVKDEYLSRKILKEFYLLSDEKIDMLEEVYDNQREVIARNYEAVHYVSLPFCPSKCSYCTFTTGVGAEYRQAYMEALLQDLAAEKLLFKDAKVLYIGGGTPSYLEDAQLAKLLEVLASYSTYDEFTLEAGRPDTITESKLDIMRTYGVDRISINPQTFNEKTLWSVNRRHGIDEIYAAYNLAVKKGFKDINMDLILGLPNEGLRDVSFTVAEVLKLAPSSVTVHCLALKRNNNLGESYIEKHRAKNKLINEMMALVCDEMSGAGYEKYYIYRQKNIGGNAENIGFCKQGYESVYNILMMEEMADVYGFGAGSISRINNKGKISRLAMPKNIKDYIGRLEELSQKRKNFVQNNEKAFR